MENKARYDKLVRDRIPDIIKKRGGDPVTRIADMEEYRRRLYAKLREEADEFLLEPSPEELADVLEVIDAIYELDGFDRGSVLALKERKAEERGGFKERVVLEEA